MARKKKTVSPVFDPEFLEKQKAALRRTRRQVIYFNEKEMAAIDEYCSRFNVTAKSSLIREAVMERILMELEENHPTLF
ncbi:MAG: hypothetical protein K5984_02805 [Bacteroidales bacterium]|nr:hypothetical protein [Bacteroidales bacterium]